MPFLLSIFFVLKFRRLKRKYSKIEYKYVSEEIGYKQYAKDLVLKLKNDGINNLNVIYQGFYNDGLYLKYNGKTVSLFDWREIMKKVAILYFFV